MRSLFLISIVCYLLKLNGEVCKLLSPARDDELPEWRYDRKIKYKLINILFIDLSINEKLFCYT